MRLTLAEKIKKQFPEIEILHTRKPVELVFKFANTVHNKEYIEGFIRQDIEKNHYGILQSISDSVPKRQFKEKPDVSGKIIVDITAIDYFEVIATYYYRDYEVIVKVEKSVFEELKNSKMCIMVSKLFETPKFVEVIEDMEEEDDSDAT